jgi:methionine sulfoxide reductase heme-binding subunit
MRRLKLLLFAAAWIPAALLAWKAWTGGLGVNPIETVTRETGTWTLRFLMATLAVTPVRRLTGWNDAIRYRRMLGLFAFFYGSLHLATWIGLDLFFAWSLVVADVMKRPYVTVGMAGFLLMVPLALTSTAGMIRRLGGRRWRLLHRLVYLSAAAGVIHYLWLVKADTARPLRYAAILAVLMALRGWFRLRPRLPGAAFSRGARSGAPERA